MKHEQSNLTVAELEVLYSKFVQEVFDEEDVDELTTGGCLDYAEVLSSCLCNIKHDYGMVIAVDENGRSTIAHVAVRVGDKYYDVEGLHSHLDLRLNWKSRAPISEHDVEIWHVDSIKAVKKQARKLGVEFHRDMSHEMREISELISQAINPQEWIKEGKLSNSNNESFERFIDDGRYFIEWNKNYERDRGNGFLLVRCHFGLTAPQGFTPAGGYEQLPNGFWLADVNAPYDEDLDSDVRRLGEYATRNEAIAALWEARETASLGARELTMESGVARSWQEACKAAEGKTPLVFGSMSEGREFNGKVLYADSVYVVQNMGRGVAIHAAGTLSRPVEHGEVVSIKYDARGRGTIPERQVGLERE